MATLNNLTGNNTGLAKKFVQVFHMVQKNPDELVGQPIIHCASQFV